VNLLATILLVIKNWKYVVQFVSILDRNIERGVNAADLEKGLNRLEKGFADVATIQETAATARDINDSFRK
jgi:hypothetical protein